MRILLAVCMALFANLAIVDVAAAQSQGRILECTIANAAACGVRAGRFTIFQASDGATSGDCTVGSGSVSVYCGCDGATCVSMNVVTATNGDIILNSAESTFDFTIDEAGPAILTCSDTGANCPLTVTSAGTGTLLLTTDGSGAVIVGDAVTTTLDLVNTGAMTLGAAASTNSVAIESAGSITLEATGAINIGDASATSVPIITDGGTVTIDGSVLAPAPAAAVASGAIAINSVTLATAAADYDIPDGACNAAGDVGNWVTIVVEDDTTLVSITSDDASNVFNVPGLDIAAGNELDNVVTAAHEGQNITLTCLAADQWYMTAGSLNLAGAATIAWADGGGAD